MFLCHFIGEGLPGAGLVPNVDMAWPIRRAAAGVTVTMSGASRSMKRAISAPTLRRADR